MTVGFKTISKHKREKNTSIQSQGYYLTSLQWSLYVLQLLITRQKVLRSAVCLWIRVRTPSLLQIYNALCCSINTVCQVSQCFCSRNTRARALARANRKIYVDERSLAMCAEWAVVLSSSLDFAHWLFTVFTPLSLERWYQIGKIHPA